MKDQISNFPPNQSIKDRVPRDQLLLSHLPDFLNKSMTFDVPIYTVWGACEDVAVLERFRSGEYKVHNLHVIDEKTSRLLDVGGVKLRLLGLGGAIVYHKLFDNGEGKTTIAGGQGTMWTTVMQIGEIVDTAQRVYDPSETRVLVTHASPARDGLLNQLAVTLKVDFSISAGLHFRYGSSYNEFSVNPSLDTYRGKLGTSKDQFKDVWDTVKIEVEPLVSENDEQKKLLRNALDIVDKMPDRTSSNPFGGNPGAGGQVDEAAFKNMWNFNLADAAYGWLVLDIDSGRIGTELKAQGFNFAHRGAKQPQSMPSMASDRFQANGPSSVGSPAQVQSRMNPPPPGPPAAQNPLQNRGNQQPVRQPGQHAPPEKPAQATPQIAQQQNTPTKQPAAATSRPAASPAAPANQNAKPAGSPAPAPQNNWNTPGDGNADKWETKPNGTAEDSTPSKGTPPPAERKPSQGIFMGSVNSDEEARNVIAESDRGKIQRIEQRGRNWVVHFNSPEEMQSALDAARQELKNRPSGASRPNIKVFEDRPKTGGWGGRGGNQSGYRSGGGGGAASDSDTNRRGGGANRGAYRRGGARNRGGRGGGTGRPGQGESGSSPAPASTPA